MASGDTGRWHGDRAGGRDGVAGPPLGRCGGEADPAAGRTGSGAAAEPDEAGHVHQPVPVGRDLELLGAHFTEQPPDPVLALGHRGGVAQAQLRRVGLDAEPGAGLGIDHVEQAHRGDVELPGVGHLGRHHLVAQGEAAQRRRPVGRVQEVGHRDDLAPPALGPSDLGQGGGQVGARPRARFPPGAVVQPRQHRHDGPAAATGRHPNQAVAAGHQHPEAVSGPGAEEPEGGHRGQRHLSFLPLGGAEVEAGGAVHHDPRLQLPVGVGGADVGGEDPGGQVPVDAPGVVTGAVGPGARGFGPGADGDGVVVAAHQAVQAAGDVQLQAAQERRLGGHHPRPR